MRSEARHVKRFRESDAGAKFLAAHTCVGEALEVDDEKLGEPVDCQVFFNVNLAFAGRALKARVDHTLRFYELVQAVT